MKATVVGLGWRPMVVGFAASGSRLTAAVLLIALTFGFLVSSRAADPPPSGRTFETLTVRGTTYTSVTIVDITKRHVSFRSAQGFATVLLEDLDAETLSKLGRGSSNTGSSERAANPTGAARNDKALPVHARENTKDSTPEEEADDDPDELDAKPIHWTVRSGIAAALLGLGGLAVCVAHIWLICAGFHKGVLWGIVLLFGSFLAMVMFCFTHWDAARRPVLLTVVGVLLAGCGLKLWG